MTPTIINPADKQAWLALRAHDLTSTEAAVLFDKSPYLTLPELWEMKSQNQIQVLEENERMFWGTALQDAIAQAAALKQGWTNVRRMDEYMRLDDLRLGASFDYCCDTPLGPAILEVKNVDGFIFKKEWPDDKDGTQAPVHIELQVQHQMLVSGYKLAYIVALVGGNRLVVVGRAADPEVQAAMLQKCSAFWASIDERQAPTLDFERDADYILSRYRTVIPQKIVDVSEVPGLREYVQAYSDLGTQMSTLDKKRDGLKARIVTFIGDAEKALGPDYSITTKKTKDGRSILVTWK